MSAMNGKADAANKNNYENLTSPTHGETSVNFEVLKQFD